MNLPKVQPTDLTHLDEQLGFARTPGVTNPSTIILPILRDLWDNIVFPVCDSLAQLGVP